MTLAHAVFYEPGHFHAALTLRTPNPRLAPDIHVYATPGPERQAFVTLVESFNTRAEHPTHWRLHLHDSPQLLQRLVADGHGDFVVLAGRNNTKLETMASLTQAGLHVLADKPWLTDSWQLPYLVQVTAGRGRHGPDDGAARVRARLIAQVVHTPELFGTFVTQESAAPAIDIASVHHLYKRVNDAVATPGMVLRYRPSGRWVVDVQSHMVEQAQWWVLGEAEGDGEHDIVLDSVRCWTTPVPLALFHESTGLDAYPEALQSSVRDGVLQYACNGEIRYRLRGVSVRQTAEWRQREPEGSGDLHRLTIRGSRCHVLVCQDGSGDFRCSTLQRLASRWGPSPALFLRAGGAFPRACWRTFLAWGVFAASTGARARPRTSVRARPQYLSGSP
jgi:hypothetical protein